MTADHEQEPSRPDERDALKEAKRYVAEAERHESHVAQHERYAQFLDERGDRDGAELERQRANAARDAARIAWDRANALQGPTQVTDAGLEIPIPTRDAFLQNLETVAPAPSMPLDSDDSSSSE